MFKKFNYLHPSNVEENGGNPKIDCSWCKSTYSVYSRGLTSEKAVFSATKEGWVFIDHRGTSGPCCPSCRENLIDEVSQQ